MIALALLHPRQVEPVHCWTFDQVSLIRIGRSPDNDVILYSAVISRYHLELHHQAGEWWAINRGKNGTYLNDVPIKYSRLTDKTTLCLAQSGPRLRISLTDQVLGIPTPFDTQADLRKPMEKNETETTMDQTTIVDMRVGMRVDMRSGRFG